MHAKYRAFGLTLLALLALDQGTKAWVVATLREDVDTISIIDGWLLFEHARNDGAAFSMLEGQMGVFAVLTVVAVAVLAQMLRQLEPGDRFQAAAVGVIASGVLGNAIDRARVQSVTDFIRVYTEDPRLSGWLTGHGLPTAWPVFNVADVCIFLGLGMFLVHFLFLETDTEAEPEPPAQPLET